MAKAKASPRVRLQSRITRHEAKNKRATELITKRTARIRELKVKLAKLK